TFEGRAPGMAEALDVALVTGVVGVCAGVGGLDEQPERASVTTAAATATRGSVRRRRLLRHPA
ncbi:hypothetical protein CN510_17290, partial [Priestia megaterium]